MEAGEYQHGAILTWKMGLWTTSSNAITNLGNNLGKPVDYCYQSTLAFIADIGTYCGNILLNKTHISIIPLLILPQ